MGVIKNLYSYYYFKTFNTSGLLIVPDGIEKRFDFWNVIGYLYNNDSANMEIFVKKINHDYITHYMNIEPTNKLTIELGDGGFVECLMF